MKAMLSASYA